MNCRRQSSQLVSFGVEVAQGASNYLLGDFARLLSLGRRLS